MDDAAETARQRNAFVDFAIAAVDYSLARIAYLRRRAASDEAPAPQWQEEVDQFGRLLHQAGCNLIQALLDDLPDNAYVRHRFKVREVVDPESRHPTPVPVLECSVGNGAICFPRYATVLPDIPGVQWPAPEHWLEFIALYRHITGRLPETD